MTHQRVEAFLVRGQWPERWLVWRGPTSSLRPSLRCASGATWLRTR